MEKVEAFLSYLLEANRQLNLTAIRDIETARVRHAEDTQMLLNAADFENKKVIDIGSGCGVPGIIIKLLCPSAEVTLLDATAKKVNFLRNACAFLDIDVQCVHARAEDYARTNARESFDIATARGVAALPALCEISLPFVKPGGLFLAMKERGSETALFETFGARRLDDYSYTLSSGLTHTIIRAEKFRATPDKYPRSWREITNPVIATVSNKKIPR